MRDEIIFIDITSHPGNKESEIVPWVCAICCSFTEGFSDTTASSITDYAITFLIVCSELIEVSLIDNDNEGENISVPQSGFVVDFHSEVFGIVRVLVL